MAFPGRRIRPTTAWEGHRTLLAGYRGELIALKIRAPILREMARISWMKTSDSPTRKLTSDLWQRACRVLLLVCSAMAVSDARAHPISVTRALVYVNRQQVSSKIEVLVEDLFLFHNLKPNDQDFLEPQVVRQGIEKHMQFLLERFVIRDVAGQRLSGRVADVQQRDLPPEGIALAELMSHKLMFELRYTLPAEPEFLTFSQHFADEEVTIPAEMHLVVKQESSGAPHVATLKSGESEIIRFSWTNPPLSPEASQQEQDAWLAKHKQETLGITSYNSVYSFLYIEDREVRHEILIPLVTLEESVTIERDDDAFLDIAEQDAARPQIEAYFSSGNPIEIDGVQVTPVVQRCDFYGLDFKDFAKPTEPTRVSVSSARLGIILSYRTDDSPTSVQLTWDRFNKYVWTVDMIVYAYETSTKTALSRIGNKNTFRWQSPGPPPVTPPPTQIHVVLPPLPVLSIPVVSLVCLALLPAVTWRLKSRRGAGRWYGFAVCAIGLCAAATWPVLRWDVPNPIAAPAQLSDVQVDAIFATLHKNVFRAFDYHDENDIYDALAQSVDGELLGDLYLQIRRGLQMQQQGGAVSRIHEVNTIDGHTDPLPTSAGYDERGFRYRCRWTVHAAVEHWGHIHSRTNEYQATFGVQPRHGAWKITELALLDEKRVNFETKLRGL